MIKNIPNIPTADILLDRAFKKTRKIYISDKDSFYRKKKTILARTESFSKTIIQNLEKIVKNFPSINQMPPFYQDILNIKMDINKIKKSLGAVNWASKNSKNIFTKQITSMRKSKNPDFLKQKQKEIYGRISSVVKQVKKDLVNLEKARNLLKDIPEIRDVPTIVIAGYPNVGKSSLLRLLSAAKPKIAQYPFTTKKIYVGHIQKEEHYEKNIFQIIDTPGLLDRNLEKRNIIEKQAISALSHLADVIIFLLDPSETCGYSLDHQYNLLEDLKSMFNKSDFIIVENKKDIKKTNSENYKISCETTEGIEDLKKEIFLKIK